MQTANRTLIPPIRLVADEQESRISSALVGVLLFVYFGRIAELMSLHLGSSLRVALVMMMVTGVAAILSGGVRQAFGNAAGLAYMGLTGWLILCIPFSVYRRGSFETVTSNWFPTFVMFVCVAGGLTTLKDCRRALLGVAAGVSVITILAYVDRVERGGRLYIGYVSLGNPNYVAMVFLYGIPILLYLAYHFGIFSLRGLLAATGVIAGLWVVVLTGSRGGFLGLLMGLAAAFCYAPAAAKAKMIGAALIGAVVLILLAPANIRARYFTTFSEENTADDVELESAVLSSEARMGHLRDSIRITFEKPLFGAGPGQFTVAEAHEAEEQGRSGRWLETHNAYTEISSEAGIPAFLLYMTPIAYSLRGLHRTLRSLQKVPERKDEWMMGICILASFAGLLVTSFFASVAYMPYMPILVGITLTYARAIETEVKPAADGSTSHIQPFWPGLRMPKATTQPQAGEHPLPSRNKTDVRNSRIRQTRAR